MKKCFALFLLLELTKISCGQTQFNFRYGSPLYDRARKTIETREGNYLVVGTTEGFGSAGNVFMMKVGVAGNIIWLKDYTGINWEEPYDIIELSDGKLVMCGTTNSYGAGSTDAFVMETDDSGNIIWAKAYGNILGESFYKIIEGKKGEGGFYVAGLAQKVQGGIEGTALLKLDTTGNIIWKKWLDAWCTEGSWYPIDITGISSGGVALTGSRCGTSILGWKFSSVGNLMWSNSYTADAGGFTTGLAILEDAVGNIYLNSNINGVAHSHDIAILKLQSNGNLTWLKTYGGTYTDWDRGIANTRDTGIIVTGSTNSAGNGDFDACLIKLSQNGSVQWANAYGSVWYETSANAIQTSDNGYLITGQTFSFGTNTDSSKILLVKTDALGQSSCNSVSWTPIEGNETVTITSTIAPDTLSLSVNSVTWPVHDRSFYEFNQCNVTSIWWSSDRGDLNALPNPFSNELGFFIADQGQGIVSLFNFLGQRVLQQAFSSSTTINTERLADGIYFYEISNDREILKTGKLIKQ